MSDQGKAPKKYGHPGGAPGGYNHGEAFCLMKYVCKGCGFQEILWNSRDGVTPFGISCERCHGHNMLHDAWQLDTFEPKYIPVPGQRIFIDLTREVMAEVVKKRLESARGTKYERPEEEWPEIIERCVEEAFSHGGSPPDVQVVPDGPDGKIGLEYKPPNRLAEPQGPFGFPKRFA